MFRQQKNLQKPNLNPKKYQIGNLLTHGYVSRGVLIDRHWMVSIERYEKNRFEENSTDIFLEVRRTETFGIENPNFTQKQLSLIIFHENVDVN